MTRLRTYLASAAVAHTPGERMLLELSAERFARRVAVKHTKAPKPNSADKAVGGVK